MVPEARGRAAKITQDAEAYRLQTVADANGQTSRFLQIYAQYKKAPDVTRERMYLETMERVLGGTDKTIIDTGPAAGPGVVPYLTAQRSAARSIPRRRRSRNREAINEIEPRRRRYRRMLLLVVIVGYSTFFTVYQTRQALVVRLGQPVQRHHRAGPQRQFRSSTRDLYR